MNIVYLTQQLHFDGPKLGGRSLARHLASENNVLVRGGVVDPGSDLLKGHLADVLVTPAGLADVDAVYMEGGWNDPALGEDLARFPIEIAKDFVANGGVLVIADLSKNAAAKQAAALTQARDLIKTQVRTGEMLGHEGVRYLYDAAALEEGGGVRFFVSEMRVDTWLAPALDGIDSLLTGGAVDLLPAGGVAASAHPTTSIHIDDLSTGESYPWAWASADEYGAGHIAVIGARISYDALVDHCPDNARWISHLLDLLVSRSRENRTWTAQSATAATGHDLDALIAAEESQQLERKSSFLTPTDPNRANTPEEDIQHAVGKSIAALANTDGGHVIIGQDDDGTVIGLEVDFGAVRPNNRDGFQQRLVQYCKNHLTPGWGTLGLRLHWVPRPEGDVAVVEVPRSSEVVHLKVSKKGQPHKQVVYVRMATTTHEVEGPELVRWIQSRTRT